MTGPGNRQENDEMVPGLAFDDELHGFIRIVEADPETTPDNNTSTDLAATSGRPVSAEGRDAGVGLDTKNFLVTRVPPDPDRTRQTITYGLLLLLTAVVVAYVGLSAAHVFTVDEAGQVFDRVFTPVLALAGTATGFYFGDPQHRPHRRPAHHDQGS